VPLPGRLTGYIVRLETFLEIPSFSSLNFTVATRRRQVKRSVEPVEKLKFYFFFDD